MGVVEGGGGLGEGWRMVVSEGGVGGSVEVVDESSASRAVEVRWESEVPR